MKTMELRMQIEAAALKAGEIMLSADRIKAATDEKSGHANFVTEYDRKVQEFLFEELARILPEASFVGEEDGAERFREEYRTGFSFVIDPIDGTTNFIKAYRPSVTSIGLLLDGKPFIGVIYNPYQGVLYSAERGKGAFRNGTPILPIMRSSRPGRSGSPSSISIGRSICGAAEAPRGISACWRRALQASTTS